MFTVPFFNIVWKQHVAKTSRIQFILRIFFFFLPFLFVRSTILQFQNISILEYLLHTPQKIHSRFWYSQSYWIIKSMFDTSYRWVQILVNIDNEILK